MDYKDEGVVKSKRGTQFRIWAIGILKQLLSGNGSVTHKQAVEKADGEYKKYKERTLSDVEQDFLNSIKILGKKTDTNSLKTEK